MKRQRGYTQHIVHIEPGALAFSGSESEEILEYFLVNDDASNNSNKHKHATETNNPVSDIIR